MKSRLNYFNASPKAFQAQLALSQFVDQCGLEPSLWELVKIRASQINGCAYCLEMHTREAAAAGETAPRLNLIAAWQESPLYTERERAALAWTEAVTLVASSRVPDEVFAQVRPHFNDTELVNLTLAIGVINTWNRLAVSFRAVHPLPKAG